MLTSVYTSTGNLVSPPRLLSLHHGNGNYAALPKLLGWEGDQIHWEETAVLDHDRGQELLVKQALHVQMTPIKFQTSVGMAKEANE